MNFEESSIQKTKYPVSIIFIILYQLFEAFAYYGVIAVVALYSVDILKYDENSSTVIYHVILMFAHVFPIIGAMISDSWLGNFATISYINVIYVAGTLLLLASALPMLQLPVRAIFMVALLFISFGTGAIQPCITAFGGDQFKLPEQKAHLKAFFSYFFFSMNVGIFLSTLVTPIFRKDFTCFGMNTCYPLAFLVPSAFMVLAIVVHFAGTRLYTIKKPEGNIVLRVTKCMSYAVSQKIHSSDKRKHWLDYADDEYDKSEIEDIKSVFKVLKLFIPLPLFYALFDQQGSRWTFQATRMDGEIFGYFIKPDQLQVANSLLVVMLIPFFQFVIYPFIERFLCINTPLRKMTCGGMIAGLAFIVSGFLEIKLEATFSPQPSSGLAQVRIFNTFDCNTNLTLDNQQYYLKALDIYQNLSIPAHQVTNLSLKVKYQNCPYTNAPNYTFITTLEAKEAQATSWFMTKDGVSPSFKDRIERVESGDPSMRALIYVDGKISTSNLTIKLDGGKDHYVINVPKEPRFTDFIGVNHNTYEVTFNDEEISDHFVPQFGGIYTIVGFVTDTRRRFRLVTVAEPNSIHMLWQLPQYIILTMGEVMFSITGFEFAYSQAPESMKSLLQAVWLMVDACGNVIVIIVAETRIMDRQVLEFFLFAGLMIIDMVIFAFMANSYEYVKTETNNTNGGDNMQMEMHSQGASEKVYSKEL